MAAPARAGGPRVRLDFVIARWCALMGAFGVLSGYAVFFLFAEEGENPARFEIALGVATVLSMLFEKVRELINRGSSEEQPWSISRMVVSFVMLAMAEFFVMASHSALTAVVDWNTFKDSICAIMGSAGADSPYGYLELAVLAGLWMCVGGALVALLSRGIRTRREGMLREVAWQTLWGAFVGAVCAPIVLLAYIVATRVALGMYLILFDRKTWLHNLRQIESVCDDLYFTKVFQFLEGPDYWWGPPLMLAVAIGVAAACRGKQLLYPRIVLIGAIVICFAAPLLPGFVDLLLMMGRAMLIWLIPGMLLGALLPLLNRPSVAPDKWAGIAFVTALVILALTFARLTGRWWILLPIGALALTAIAMYRSREGGSRALRIEDYWPVLSLSVAMLVFGVTFLSQEVATFAGVYQSFHVLSELHSQLPDAQKWLEGPFQYPKPSTFSFELTPQDIAGYIDASRNEKQQLDQLAAQMSKMIAEEHERLNRQSEWIKGARDQIAKLNHEPFLERMKPVVQLGHKFHEYRDTAERSREYVSSLLWNLVFKFEPSIPKDAESMPLDVAASIRNYDAKVFATPSIPKNAEAMPLDVAASIRNDRVKLFAELEESFKREKMMHELAAIQATIRAGKNQLQNNLEGLRSEIDHKQSELNLVAREEFGPLARAPARWLELAMAGSVGFWATTGLLAGWSIFNHGSETEAKAESASESRTSTSRV